MTFSYNKVTANSKFTEHLTRVGGDTKETTEKIAMLKKAAKRHLISLLGC